MFGLHLPLCLAVAWPLRLDALIVYGAAQISNPLFAPALLALELAVGSLLLTGRSIGPTELGSFPVLLEGILLPVAVGAPVVGVAAALAAGTLTAAAVRRVQATPRPERPTIYRTIRRYRRAPPRHRFYVALKLRLDPIYRTLANARPSVGDVLDAGCGRGQLGLFLKDLGLARSVRGFDTDGEKVLTALRASRKPGAFWVQSLEQGSGWPKVDTVLLVDVLHYVNAEVQELALNAAVEALRPGGRLIIREIDASRWRPGGRVAEHLGVRLGVNRASRLQFLRREHLEASLTARGLHVTRLADNERSTLANFLIVATRT